MWGEEKIYFNQDLIAENRRLKEALAACQGILEVRDAALAAAEAMGLSYEVLGLFSAGLTLVLAIAIWVHYRGTPFVVDRIDQLTIFDIIYFSIFLYSDCYKSGFMHYFTKYPFSYFGLLVKGPVIHALLTIYIFFIGYYYFFIFYF